MIWNFALQTPQVFVLLPSSQPRHLPITMAFPESKLALVQAPSSLLTSILESVDDLRKDVSQLHERNESLSYELQRQQESR